MFEPETEAGESQRIRTNDGVEEAMRNRFDRQLAQLNNEMIQMGSLIEEAIELATGALLNKDMEKAREAIEFDKEIDQQEKEIESLCLKLLLQQQPVARDLRQISAALKMITDMERIGDHASDIGDITLQMADTAYVNNLEYIQDMAKETTVMLVQSIEAYVNKDQEQAARIIEQDDVVDNLFDKMKAELIEWIAKNPEKGEQVADLLLIAKYFERIGDHATNIAEWVIFSITGKHKEDMDED